MIKAEKLKKEFRVHGNVFKILEDIDIEINDGEFIAIMGPSGAGKSTLEHIIYNRKTNFWKCKIR